MPGALASPECQPEREADFSLPSDIKFKNFTSACNTLHCEMLRLALVQQLYSVKGVNHAVGRLGLVHSRPTEEGIKKNDINLWHWFHGP
jgi:hypothetical protein